VDRPGRPLVFVAVAVAYLAAGKLGLMLASVHPSATAVWAPTGIALAAFLRLGHGAWPAIFCAAFLLNATTAGSIATSLGIAAGNTLEAAVGARLVMRFAPASPAFSRPADVYAFTALAALVSPAVSAVFGVTSLALGGYARWADYGAIWATWWLGDAAGALIVAPPLLLWSAGRPRPWRGRRRLAEALVMLLVVVAVGRAVFSDWLPPPVQRLEFLGMPALVWVAFRFGQREAATATLVMSALAIWGTVQGVGPFAGASANAALLSLQAYMSIITLTALVLAAAVDDRRRADLARLGEARDRVRAHEALEKSEELHRAIAELASDFAVIVRVEPDGTVVLESATEGFRQVTGYEPDELAGPARWRRLLDAASAADAQSAGRRVLAGERVSLEVRIITKSGVERWLRCHAQPFGGAARDDGVRILGAAEDVTERRQTDETLRRHREAIRELSTPVLRIRDRLLILPVIGEIDGPRARHLTAELLSSIRTNRAKVVVIDMTGVATMNAQVAQQMLSTIEACRLLGASIIITGLSHAIADVLVSFGVDLGRVTSLGDLQSGMEEAERLLAADGAAGGPEPAAPPGGAPSLGGRPWRPRRSP
jgi:PAS domain S-box-containing protein